MKKGYSNSWEDDRMFAVFAPVLYHHRWIDKEEKKIGHENSHRDACLFVTMFVYPFSLPQTFLLFDYKELFLRYFANPLLRYVPTNFQKMPNSDTFT